MHQTAKREIAHVGSAVLPLDFPHIKQTCNDGVQRTFMIADLASQSYSAPEFCLSEELKQEYRVQV